MSRRVFEIRVKGEMGPKLREEFEDVELTIGRSITRLRVVSGDASALHGILDRLESCGLELIDLHSVDAPQASPLLGSPEPG